MDPVKNKVDFSNLLPFVKTKELLQRLTNLTSNNNLLSPESGSIRRNKYLNECFKKWQDEWYSLLPSKASDSTIQTSDDRERAATNWLIQLFNTLFAAQKVVLVRSEGEPEYFPAQNNEPARIAFAHGFFASALHEASHWCIAGDARRRLPDFGYWYAPDGRSVAQQQAFERVEIKPQALECLFTLACGRSFQVSQDNLFATFDTSSSTFENDVYRQVEEYIAKPHTLPRDAKVLLHALLTVCATGDANDGTWA
ncbi:hypothetical protein DVY93_03960 [Psychrobacter sp. CCUG 69069]|jgi:hypothetical protein|uniref:elongation factor P hydroxylase n=1 Tax=Psychrobacter TaxID=497 RepID=UPI001E55B697|nr:elongation factor P hydroxylase [Psychrobacter sp. CCUG 69069]MCD1278909.1 hypothetical protein [Psychrobacter sp. CCUG 69069]|tara:strand:- start:1036 stop:1797 length:762 start_codon:yes stop_codon:yes gene_type:complete